MVKVDESDNDDDDSDDDDDVRYDDDNDNGDDHCDKTMKTTQIRLNNPRVLFPYCCKNYVIVEWNRIRLLKAITWDSLATERAIGRNFSVTAH